MKARISGAQNQGNMMKKIQQMQEDMTRIQEEIESTEYTSSDPRSFKVVQGQIEGQNNAVAGEQYKFLTR